MLVLSQAEVRDLLDPRRLIDALAAAMADLSRGAASMPARIAVRVAERDGILAAMPAYLPSTRALASKLVSLFPHNAGLSLPTHQAVIVVFDAATGSPLALLDGEYITALRTAAGSALATRLLARDDVAVLAVLGTGVQARAHLRALPLVRSFSLVRLAGRNRPSAEQLAAEVGPQIGTPVTVMNSFQEALAEADVVCACTHSPEPVVRREWLRPGVHVNSVGYNPEGCEVDAATVRDAVVVVEARSAALAPYPAGANDLNWPIRDGVIRPDHVQAEIGELVLGTASGRTSPEEITLYKSVGVAVQDAAAAALVLEAAKERGVGTQVEL